MTETCFLVFDREGVLSVRSLNPELHEGEYVVRLHISIPDKFFDRSTPTAEIAVAIPENYPGDSVISAGR